MRARRRVVEVGGDRGETVLAVVAGKREMWGFRSPLASEAMTRCQNTSEDLQKAFEAFTTINDASEFSRAVKKLCPA